MRYNLFLLSRGTSSSDETSVSLSTVHEPVLEAGPLAFPLAGVRAGARATLVTDYICPRDLHAPRLVTPLSHYNVDVIQRG
jgi:hypothetical protein